ncbi:MAG: hypothetical protein ABID38_04750 [Candidatus Diapherotrites archaeon]
MKWTQANKDRFVELLKEGESLKEIAEYFGCSYSVIKWVKSKYKLSKRLVGGKKHRKIEELKASKKDLATRIRVLRGEEVRTQQAHFGFTDEQLKNWFKGTTGVDKFCKDVLGIELQDYQLEMVKLMLNHKRCVFVLGRQSGKDFTIACFALWLSVVNSNQRILLVSAAQRQSDLLFNRIMNFIAKSNELFDSVQKSNMEVIQFTNGSEVYSLPSTTYIRGYTEVTHIFMNEVAHGITEDTIQATEPMLAIKRGSLIMMSSPLGTNGVLWDAYNNPIYVKLKLPSGINKYISKDWLEDQKKTMSSLAYETEIEANFSQAIDSFFKLETIKSVTREYTLRNTCPKEDGKSYYAGVDWGRIQDSSVVVIISKNKEKELKVESIIEMHNIPFKIQEERIKQINSDWKFKKVISEYAGLSINSCENLKRDGLNVEFFKPTLDSKAEAYNHLLKQMEDGNLAIPMHNKLQYELRVFKFQLNAAGKMKLHHVEGGSDDFVDALCYACWGTKTRGVIFAIGDKMWIDGELVEC